MTDLQWLEERKKGLGGSDAGAILGLSKWKTPYQVWLDKTNRGPLTEDSSVMEWGRRLEPVIRQKYCDLTGRSVFVPGKDKILAHPKIEWMLASLDGVVDSRRVFEAKTARFADGWGEPGTDEIPDVYQIQVQHYMAVTGFDVADVAVLIGGSDFRLYEVPKDNELIEMIIEKEAIFWRMVKKNIQPDPQTLADLKLKFGTKSEAKKVQATPQAKEAHERLCHIKALSKEEDACKAIIMELLGEADTLIDGNETLVTWKATNGSNRFDAKTFQADYPELYGQYLKKSEPTRRFLTK